MTRRTALVCVGLAVPVIALGAWLANEYWPRQPPRLLDAPRAPELPDLTMPRLTEVFAGRRTDGTPVLFFTAAIANTGKGPFLVHAVRADERSAWRVTQRFQEEDGSLSEERTPAAMRWGGHGHDHWHVELGASYVLTRIGGSPADVRRYRKQGFCFFDQQRFDLSLPDASRLPEIPKTTCDGFHERVIDMGLSVGWKDPYQWTLPDQELPLTGLRDGIYRLTATADPGNWFRETDDDNNSTWVEVRLTTSVNPPLARVLAVAPD